MSARCRVARGVESCPGELLVGRVPCDSSTLALAGSVDRWTAPILRTHVAFVLGAGVGRVVLDLRGACVDEGGTAVLAGIRAMVEAAGAVLCVEGADGVDAGVVS